MERGRGGGRGRGGQAKLSDEDAARVKRLQEARIEAMEVKFQHIMQCFVIIMNCITLFRNMQINRSISLDYCIVSIQK